MINDGEVEEPGFESGSDTVDHRGSGECAPPGVSAGDKQIAARIYTHQMVSDLRASLATLYRPLEGRLITVLRGVVISAKLPKRLWCSSVE